MQVVETFHDSLSDRTYWMVRNACRLALNKCDTVDEASLHFEHLRHHWSKASVLNLLETKELEKLQQLIELITEFVEVGSRSSV